MIQIAFLIQQSSEFIQLLPHSVIIREIKDGQKDNTVRGICFDYNGLGRRISDIACRGLFLGDHQRLARLETLLQGEQIPLKALSDADLCQKAGFLCGLPGYLPGFSADIDDFAEAAMFAPMIGSIAFVGYIFRLDEGADVDAFMQTLRDNADPSWNICVTAEETVIDAVDNTVFFVMTPGSAA